MNQSIQRTGVSYYFDGGCRDGYGAWAVVRETGGVLFVVASGVAQVTTSNRMELTGLIAALEIAEAGDRVLGDSQLSINTVNDYAAKWKAKGWKTGERKPVKNLDLVEQAFELRRSKPRVEVAWVRGHSGIPGNELADKTCTHLLNPELSSAPPADALFHCVIPGRVGLKKNGRRLRRIGHGRITSATSERYEEWASDASVYIRQAWRGRPPIRVPVNVKMIFYFPNRKNEPDLSNLYQGPEDMLEEMGVLANDKLIHSHDGSRKIFGSEARVEITVTEFEG